MSISAMKKNRMSFETLAEKFKQSDSKSNQNKDDRQFYPARDENGNAQAVIRFLPPKEGEEVPWVKICMQIERGSVVKWNRLRQGNCSISQAPSTVYRQCSSSNR